MVAVDPFVVIRVSIAGGLLAIAALLAAIRFSDRLNRSLALSLFLQAPSPLLEIVPDRSVTWFAAGMTMRAMTLVASYPLLYLAACYLERFGVRRGVRRVTFGLTLVAGTIEVLLFLRDPAPFFWAGAGFGARWDAFVSYFGPALVAAVLARDGFLHPDPQRRRWLRTASLGFAFQPLAFAIHLTVPGLMGVDPVTAWVGVAALAPLGYVVLQTLRPPAGRGSGEPPSASRVYLALMGSAPASTLVLVALLVAGAPLPVLHFTMLLLMGFWTIAGALIIAYTVLRHQLFGLERGMKWTLSRGTFAAAVVAVFVISAQLAESFMQNVVGSYSWVLGGLGAAIAVFAFLPLRRLADRFAGAAMPHVEDTPQYTAFRRLQLYESAVAAAWEDGAMAGRERDKLERLRRRLGIAARDAALVEEGFQRTARLLSTSVDT